MYKIVYSRSIEDLERTVNEMLADGWQLSGSVSVVVDKNILKFFQALQRFHV